MGSLNDTAIAYPSGPGVAYVWTESDSGGIYTEYSFANLNFFFYFFFYFSSFLSGSVFSVTILWPAPAKRLSEWSKVQEVSPGVTEEYRCGLAKYGTLSNTEFPGFGGLVEYVS